MLDPDALDDAAPKRARRRGPARAAPKRARRRGPARAAPAPLVINDPEADWMPLVEAFSRCFRSGYARTAGQWAEALRAHVEYEAWRLVEDCTPEFSLPQNPQDDPCVTISGMGLELHISPGYITLARNKPRYRSLIAGRTETILKERKWKDIPSVDRLAAKWHRQLISSLVICWDMNFWQALYSGTLHIMARKNTVLAPFERIAFDQWQYFRLDEEPAEKERIVEYPLTSFGTEWRSTATGPAGEKLYSIHVAPGVGDSRELGSEEKCVRWLVGLRRNSRQAANAAGRTRQGRHVTI
jgi:hypothetical protein